jgi:mono/diheme cytochrome c family protein
MTFFTIKTILALILFLTGLSSLFSMMALMGKQDKKTSPATLKKIHKISGIIFSLLLLALAVLGYQYWVKAGDQISLRATLHAVLALSLVVLLFCKIIIAKKYRQFLKFAPSLGLILFTLTFIVFSTSAGFYLLRSTYTNSDTITKADVEEQQVQGDAENGQAIFISKCSTCHHSDSEQSRFGPGLARVMKKDTLPSSGRPSTWGNVLQQIKQPSGAMPAFPDFSDTELADLRSYLKSL